MIHTQKNKRALFCGIKRRLPAVVRIASILLVVVLSGCGTFENLRFAAPQEKFERELERHHYRQAIAIAEREIQKHERQQLKFEQQAAEQLAEENQAAQDQQTENSVEQKEKAPAQIELAVEQAEEQQEEIQQEEQDKPQEEQIISTENSIILEWKNRLKNAESSAKAFEAVSTQEVTSLLSKNDWVAVDEKLGFLMRYLPESQAFNEFFDRVAEQRKDYISTLKHELLKHEMLAIPSALSLYDKLYDADVSDRLTQRQRRSYLRRQSFLLEQLGEAFNAAEARGDWQEAIYFGKSIGKLSPSEELDQKLAALEAKFAEKVKQENQRTAIKRAAILASNEQALNERYKVALEEERWYDAKNMLDQVLKLSPDDAEWKARRESFQRQLVQVVDTGRQQGETLYADGNIEAAVQVWEEVLTLAPDDQKLLANIERAKRILEKIESIKSEQ